MVPLQPEHAGVGIEGLALFFGRVVRRPAHGEFCFSAGHIFERKRREHFQRPVFISGMTRDATLFVGKRIDEDHSFLRDDFAVDELAPHRLPVRRISMP